MGIPRNQLPPQIQALLRSAAAAGPVVGIHAVPQTGIRGRRRDSGYRSALEERYAQRLALLLGCHEIAWWEYEPMRLRLGPVGARLTYCPDFMVMPRAGGRIEAHEVKGHWDIKGRNKVKMAARLFPWIRFRGVQGGRRGEWSFEEFLGPTLLEHDPNGF
jgi:hypothetical protein